MKRPELPFFRFVLPLVSLLAVAGATFYLMSSGTLEPEVRQDFFFASDDPAMVQSEQIQRRFGSQVQLAIISRSADAQSDAYLDRVERLTQALNALPFVVSITSLSNGPGDYATAMESEFWGPLLLTDAGQASNIILVIDNRDQAQSIAELEALIDAQQQEGFELFLSGTPYVTEMLKRDLAVDFKRMGVVALAVMAVILFAVFRSFAVLIGGLTASIGAVTVTLLIQRAMSLPLGVLTANLTTIVVVMVISHVVFLTGNWQRQFAEQSESRLASTKAAWLQTMRASFWCAATTLAGFATLFMVDAEPLRQLGVGGAIGTAAALFAAFVIYPPFLLWMQPAKTAAMSSDTRQGIAGFWRKPMLPAVGIFGALIVLALVMLPRLNLDPSLFSYFDSDGEVERGLRFADRNGGSSPLTLSIRHKEGKRLDEKETYEELWAVHDALLDDERVGTVISLPLLMAEADDHPLSFLFSFETLISFLQSPKFDRVGDRFITADRRSAFFLLRMVEEKRGDTPRLEVIEELKETANARNFNVELVGGVYFLQGELSRLVGKSLWTGLLGLLFFVFAVAGFISANWRTTLAIGLTAAAIPIIIFGAFGLFAIPLDMIAAPAASVAVGMAVDMMIHLAVAARRSSAEGWNAWQEARIEQWKSIAIATAIVTAGFLVFTLSTFPPTKRFGIAVAIGAVIAAIFSLWMLPVLAGFRQENARAKSGT